MLTKTRRRKDAFTNGTIEKVLNIQREFSDVWPRKVRCLGSTNVKQKNAPSREGNIKMWKVNTKCYRDEV